MECGVPKSKGIRLSGMKRKDMCIISAMMIRIRNKILLLELIIMAPFMTQERTISWSSGVSLGRHEDEGGSVFVC